MAKKNLNSQNLYSDKAEFIRYKLNRNYIFKISSRTENSCVSGWNKSEFEGTWTSENRALVNFPLADEPLDDITVVLHFYIFASTEIHNHIRILTHNNKLLFDQKYGNNISEVDVIFVYPKKLLRGGSIQLVIESPVYPHNIIDKTSSDSRVLGVFLRNVEFRAKVKLLKQNLENSLDIFLCTYNRKYFLEKTLKSLLARESPLRNLQITILDNASTDGTSELIDEYAQKFSNIKHIRHNRNISGNANIARAFESASKKYFWVLCDDDNYDWTNWDEIENVILSEKYDCILTERKMDFSADDLPYIINSLAFVPCGIYKTKNITDTVMSNIESNIMYSFPHLALGCSLLNQKASFYVPKYTVIRQNVHMEFTKGLNQSMHFRQSHVNLFSGYINSYQMIQDKKLRAECCNVLWIGKSFYFSMQQFFLTNGFFPYNISDVFLGINASQRLQFITAFIVFVFQYVGKKLYIQLCRLKKLLQQIFSAKNSKDKKHKVITILGMKFKFKRKKKAK